MWLSLRSIAALLLTVVAAGAFAPALNHGTKIKCLNMAKPAFMLEINQAFGILALGSVLAFQVPPASAASQHGKLECLSVDNSGLVSYSFKYLCFSPSVVLCLCFGSDQNAGLVNAIL